jgi:hypothetical protein
MIRLSSSDGRPQGAGGAVGMARSTETHRLDQQLKRAFARASRMRAAGIALKIHPRCAHEKAA